MTYEYLNSNNASSISMETHETYTLEFLLSECFHSGKKRSCRLSPMIETIDWLNLVHKRVIKDVF